MKKEEEEKKEEGEEKEETNFLQKNPTKELSVSRIPLWELFLQKKVEGCWGRRKRRKRKKEKGGRRKEEEKQKKGRKKGRGSKGLLECFVEKNLANEYLCKNFFYKKVKGWTRQASLGIERTLTNISFGATELGQGIRNRKKKKKRKKKRRCKNIYRKKKSCKGTLDVENTLVGC